MRLLGVDFGFKRIGLAIGETQAAIVTPRAAIQASGSLQKDAQAIVQLARKEEVDAVVLGLPVQEDGEEGKMARICRTLGGHLADLGESVRFVNEVYSSLEAEQLLAEAGVRPSKRKALRDGEAAGVILERFFDGQIAN